MEDPDAIPVPDPLDRIAQLESQVSTLADLIKQQIAQNRSQPVLPPVPQSRLAKINPPRIFSGDKTQADAFINENINYMNGRAIEFPNDSIKISFALSYIQGGTAQTFVDLALTAISQVGTIDPITSLPRRPPYADWNDFVRQFKKSFSDPNPQDTAQTDMSKLFQGNQNAEEYVRAFLSIAPRTGYNEVALIEKFETGLNHRLRERIYALPIMPNTLAGWCEWVQKLDNQRIRYNEKAKTIWNDTPRTQPRRDRPAAPLPAPAAPPQRQPDAPRQRDPDAMDVDRAGRRPPIKCFRCQRLGHIARNCTYADIRSMTFDELREYFRQEEGFQNGNQ